MVLDKIFAISIATEYLNIFQQQQMQTVQPMIIILKKKKLFYFFTYLLFITKLQSTIPIRKSKSLQNGLM